MKKLLIALMLGAALPAVGFAAQAKEVGIPFAGSGGIRDWRADGNRALFIQGTGGKWYRAELMSPCHGLNFANTIRFVPEPSDRFDRFSKIVVDGQACHVRSVQPAEKPGKHYDRDVRYDDNGRYDRDRRSDRYDG